VDPGADQVILPACGALWRKRSFSETPQRHNVDCQRVKGEEYHPKPTLWRFSKTHESPIMTGLVAVWRFESAGSGREEENEGF
jgi:hypothetical protein